MDVVHLIGDGGAEIEKDPAVRGEGDLAPVVFDEWIAQLLFQFVVGKGEGGL